jgi:hypothetical protein
LTPNFVIIRLLIKIALLSGPILELKIFLKKMSKFYIEESNQMLYRLPLLKLMKCCNLELAESSCDKQQGEEESSLICMG